VENAIHHSVGAIARVRVDAFERYDQWVVHEVVVHLCVCVCERERESMCVCERERARCLFGVVINGMLIRSLNTCLCVRVRVYARERAYVRGRARYEAATIGRLLTNIGFFCKRAL